MDFLKKHYEKIILGLVLVVVMFLALQIPSDINGEKRDQDERERKIKTQATNAVTPVDLVPMRQSVQNLNAPVPTKFAEPGHNVINPVLWKKGARGEMVKIPTPEDAIRRLLIKEITPLRLTILLEKELKFSADSHRMKITITDESLVPRVRRRPQSREPKVKEGESNDLFKVVAVTGPADNPSEVKIELRKGAKQIVIKRGETFSEVIAHEADLEYPPENKTFNDILVGGTISFNDERYKVIAITGSAVTIEGQTTPKRYTIEASAPTP
jgi:hypothetical protein